MVQSKVNRYLIAGSILLDQELIKLGYTHVSTKGGGTNEVKEFRNKDKIVLTGYWKITITHIEPTKEIQLYSGFSIEDQVLKFLTERNLFEIKTEKDDKPISGK